MRALLTTLAVVLGVALVFGLNGVLPAAIEAFQRNILSTSGNVDITVTNANSGFFDASVADQVSSVPGIAQATPIVRRNLSLPRGLAVASLTVVGIDPTTIQRVRSFPVLSGRLLGPSDSGAIVIGQGLASKLGLSVGSELRLPGAGGTRTFKVVGILSLPSVPGAEEVFVTLPDAEQLLATGGRINEIDASLAANANRNVVEAGVRRKLGPDYTTSGLSSFTQLLSSLKVSQFAFGMFGVFALVMGGFIILNTFRTIVAERRHDIGMLRAVGASSTTILGMFFIEAMLQGIIGVVLGLALGYLIAVGSIAALTPVYNQVINIQIGRPIFSAGTWAAAIILGMLTTFAGALGPAFSAARVTPMEALRPQVADVAEHRRHVWPWVGLALLVASSAALFTRQPNAVGAGSVGFLIGLVFVAPIVVAPITRFTSALIMWVLPAEGELARSNTIRQPGRAAVTASAVMISLAIVVALLGVVASIFSGFIGYLDKSVSGADFAILPANLLLGGGNVGADQAFVDGVRAIPGVGNVATLRVAQGTYKTSPVQVIGIDPTDYLKVATFEFTAGGSNSDIANLAEPRTVLANGVFAAQTGIKPGDMMALQTPTGLHTYKVLAIATDYLNAKLASIYASQDTLSTDFGIETNAAVLVNAKPGAPFQAVKNRLSRFVSDYPQFAFYDTKTFQALQLQIFAQTNIIFYLLIAVLAIPSFLALLNTLAISVLARTRELGMLRAVGSTRRQITAMVFAESLLLASVGVVLGVLGGVVLGYALVLAFNAVGFVSPYFFPWSGIVAAVVIGVGSAMLAALIPARTASRLDIVDALHYE